MSFQSRVNRNFTTGFPGEIVRDGPTRAKAVRFAPQATQQLIDDARNDGNIVGRAYGFSGEVPQGSATLAMLVPEVVLGGEKYAGVLIHPKHYVLHGNAANGALGASYELPEGSEGELATMAIIVGQIMNYTAAQQVIPAGWSVGYVNTTAVSADTLGLPFGALVALDPNAAPAAGITPIRGSVIENPITIPASALGAVVAGLTIITLTL